jgi:hypothetical protein
MERFVYDWVADYLMKNCPLRPSQHGFQRSKSCVTQLLDYTNDVTVSLDHGYCTDVIYLDFSKAFDKVPHVHLLRKLRSRAVPEVLVRWIASFLCQRRQRVVIKGSYSEWQPVISGVPQGSVLGPLLFAIYVDDLDTVLSNGVQVKKFADDTKLYYSYSRSDSLAAARLMQRSLDAVSAWCAQWQLPLNVRKCSVMYIGHGNLKTSYTVTGVSLPHSDHMRDLGITISSTLKFSEQSLRASAHTRKVTGMMLRAFKSRRQNVILPIYKSLIRPLLEYCTPVWNPGLKSDIAEVESVQRQITKRIVEVRGLPYAERLKVLALPTLEQRRLYFDLMECYKILHGHDVCDCVTSLQLKHTATRGHPFTLFPTAGRLLARQHAFTHRVLHAWNNLPAHIVILPTLQQFKHALRDHLRI